MKFCDVCYHFFVWLFCLKVSLQQIWRNLSHLALVRTIFLHPNSAHQPKLLHQSGDYLVITMNLPVFQLRCDSPVTVSAPVFFKNCLDFSFYGCALVPLLHPLYLIIKCGPRQVSNGQQHLQRDFWPQFLNHPRFLRWRCSSSKTKARNFFRYRFSASNRCT